RPVGAGLSPRCLPPRRRRLVVRGRRRNLSHRRAPAEAHRVLPPAGPRPFWTGLTIRPATTSSGDAAGNVLHNLSTIEANNGHSENDPRHPPRPAPGRRGACPGQRPGGGNHARGPDAEET